nr:hypothetical protein [Tanacetum cinerariifolium]
MSTQQDIYAAGSEPMLNKENYVPWSSRLLWYAKSRPNGKLIHNSILNGPYVRKMILESGDANREITTILLGLPEDIYAVVDSCETAQEIWLQNYLQQPMPNPEDITDSTTAINMALALMAKAFKLNYSTQTNNNKRISSNLKNRQIAQPGMNMDQDRQMQMVGGNGGNQFRQYAGNPARNGNLVAARTEGNTATNQIRCYNYRGVEEETGIQLQAEEYNLMAAAADLDEIKEVNANCILMANLQQASTSGTQTDNALVYDLDGLAEVHNYENCYDNETFNMFTQEEQYTELLEPIPESHQVPHNDNDVNSEDTSVEQGGETVEQHLVNFEETRAFYESLYHNLAIEVGRKSIRQEKYDKLERCYQQSVYQEQCLSEKINALHLSTEKKKLKSDFKTREDELLDKQIQLEKKINELNNILLKTGQPIQTIHMLSPKPDSFYHTGQKMALGYQNYFYLKQAQKKQQSLYDGKVLLEKHDRPVVHDSEETLQLAQESREKMKQLNKEIKPANYTKINHLSGDFVPQMGLSPKFVRDFKSLANEVDPSLAKHKALELEIERLLKAVETEYAKLWNDWYKKCDEWKYEKISYDKAYKDMQQKIEWLQAQLGDLKGKRKDTLCVSDTRNPLSQKLKNENVESEFQVLNYARENTHLKATYKNLIDSIFVSRTQTKTIITSLQKELQSTIYKNAKFRTQLFKKVSDQKDNTQDTSENTQFAKKPIVENLPKFGETNALSKPVTSNSVSSTQESKGVNNDKVIAPGMFRINPDKTSRDANKVPNTVSTRNRTKSITVSQPPVITKKDINSDLNGLSSTGVDNTKTRRPQPRSNTKHDKVPSTSTSSRSKNKEAEVEDHHRNLLLYKNNKHISSACNNIKTDSLDVISKVVCALCKKCLISVNHDKCLRNYVNGKNSSGKKQKAKVSVKENQMKYQPKDTKPKKVGTIKRLATPKPRKPRLLLRWSPTGRLFDQEGKIVDSSES